MTSAGYQQLDAHCGRTTCPCTHTGECYRGWIDIREDDHEYTIPCRTCDPQRRRVTETAPNRVELGKRLRERAKSNQPYGGNG